MDSLVHSRKNAFAIIVEKRRARKETGYNFPTPPASGRITSDVCGSYFCNSFVVPVTGLRLSAKRLNPRAALLNWETTSEFQNVGFEIERSFAGSDAGFSQIGFQGGAGTSYRTLYYSRIDSNSFRGTTYYRLRQVDINGHFVYSNVAVVNGYSAQPNLTVSPNPGSDDQINFYITGFEKTTPAAFQIIDATGRLVCNLPMQVSADSYRVALTKLVRVTAGYYYLRITTNSSTLSAPFIVQ